MRCLYSFKQKVWGRRMGWALSSNKGKRNLCRLRGVRCTCKFKLLKYVYPVILIPTPGPHLTGIGDLHRLRISFHLSFSSLPVIVSGWILQQQGTQFSLKAAEAALWTSCFSSIWLFIILRLSSLLFKVSIVDSTTSLSSVSSLISQMFEVSAQVGASLPLVSSMVRCRPRS